MKSNISAIIVILTLLVSVSCKEQVKDTSAPEQVYGNSTEYTKSSADRIDGSPTYEVSFTLDKPAGCMTVEIESAVLQKSFPVERIPKRTFFIVEKKLNLPHLKLKEMLYTPIGRNFNNEWDLYSPVKICTGTDDPVSRLDASEYRVRFSVFEKSDFYYRLTVTCDSKVTFIENIRTP